MAFSTVRSPLALAMTIGSRVPGADARCDASVSVVRWETVPAAIAAADVWRNLRRVQFDGHLSVICHLAGLWGPSPPFEGGPGWDPPWPASFAWGTWGDKLRWPSKLSMSAGTRGRAADRDSNLPPALLSTVMEERTEDGGPTDAEALRRLDAQAVARTLAGETAAFDGLIEQYQRRAVAVAYRLLGNIEDAKDVCQEAFLRAFRSLASLQDPERFGAWLMRIVSNQALNYRRGRRGTLSLATESGGATADRSPAALSRSADAAAEPMTAAETHGAVTAAIESLPEQQRLALILFAIERLPQKEVAEILECSVEMVKWNVFQARKKLKEMLAEYLE